MPKRVGRHGTSKNSHAVGWPWASPAAPPSLLSASPGPAPPSKSLTFIDGLTHLNLSLSPTGPSLLNPSLLSARPLASICQTRWGHPSRPNPTTKKPVTGKVTPYFPRLGTHPTWQTLICFHNMPYQEKGTVSATMVAQVPLQSSSNSHGSQGG